MRTTLKHVADGITAKLNFDFSCNRGRFFSEYYIHGVANEILCARTDPKTDKVICGYSFPQIQNNSRGRNKEIDFVICRNQPIDQRNNANTFKPISAIEIKWAGSSHCKDTFILKDLMRLQLLANTISNLSCFFILAGEKSKILNIFNGNSIFSPGKNSLLSLNRKKDYSNGNIKKFKTNDNNDHSQRIAKIESILSETEDWFSHISVISTKIISTAKSASPDGKFFTYAWMLQKQMLPT